MQQAVPDAFPGFTRPLEGCVLWPYLDVLGLVTVGYGCLIDPEPMAAAVAWLGSPAPGEIAQQWAELKANRGLSTLHYNYAAAYTRLRLDQAGADALLDQRMQLFEGTLRHYFPSWDAWPADAQLAAMAMAWACGSGFPLEFVNFTRFANMHDWANAAKCAAIKTTGNPGIVPRNAQVQLCLANAASSSARGLPPEQLFWPGTVPDAHEADEALRQEADLALAKHAERDQYAPESAADNLRESDTDRAPPPESSNGPELAT